MDRRYREARFNAPASDSRERQREGLVRQYLSRARSANHAAQSYGGSTGGASSANIGLGAEVLASRSAAIGEGRQVFREAGSGSLGARRSLAEARGQVGPAAG